MTAGILVRRGVRTTNMPLPGKVERPQWVTRPRRIKAGSNVAKPRLYGVWCQTPDVEAERRKQGVVPFTAGPTIRAVFCVRTRRRVMPAKGVMDPRWTATVHVSLNLRPHPGR